MGKKKKYFNEETKRIFYVIKEGPFHFFQKKEKEEPFLMKIAAYLSKPNVLGYNFHNPLI